MVPWRLIGERVQVVLGCGRVRVHHGAEVVAEHAEHSGRRQRMVVREHLAGVNVGPRRKEGEDEGATSRRCCVRWTSKRGAKRS